MSLVANAVRPKGAPKIVSSGPSSVQPEDRLAKSLGWFSIGLGAVELLAARRVTRALGLQGMEGLVRLFGIREIASGILTLSTEKRAGVKSRVAGDMLDIAVLLKGFHPHNPQRGNVKLALAAVSAATALDLFAALSLEARARRSGSVRRYSDRSGFPQGLAEARNQSKKFARA